MLVFTRKTGQAAVVRCTTDYEHMLKITVLGIGQGTVRLGFEVDASVPVHRWEVWERIRAAANTADGFEPSIVQ